MNNNDFSKNLNQNILSQQYQTSEEIQNDNLIQLSNNNEPPESESNFSPLEVSLPPAALPNVYSKEVQITLENKKNIKVPNLIFLSKKF